MIDKSEIIKTACAVLLAASANASQSQTFQVTPDSAQKTTQAPGQAPADPQGIGWGSNIQNARLARSAEQALARGDHAVAFDYAERAAEAAPNDPQIWFLLGYAARLNGHYPRAIEAYNRGLKLSPGSADAESGLAQTYALMGRTAEAERLLRQLVSSHPERVNDLLVLGSLLIHAGEYQQAVEPLARAEARQPGTQAELLLASAYQHLGQKDQASHFLLLARSHAPGNPDVMRSLAAFYRDSGDYAQAIAQLRAIRNPQPDVVAELAYTSQLAGKAEDAATLYAQAANALPRDLNLQLSAAQSAVAINQPGRATPFLARAAQLDPEAYRLHVIRGQIDELDEKKTEAAAEYTRALAHLPAAPPEGVLYPIELHMDLVRLYDDLGQQDKVHEQLASAQQMIGALDEQGPGRPAFLRLRALVKAKAGDNAGALGDLQAAMALSQGDNNTLQMEGDLLIKLGRVEDGIAAYRKVLASDPKSRNTLTALGYASRLAGNDAEAEKYFNQLAKYYPTLYTPYLALGDMYASHHEYSKALAAYEKGYALAPSNVSIVSGGLNASLEAHDLPLAGTWFNRVQDPMRDAPLLMREQERYLFFTGRYAESAAIGQRVIQNMPHDREVVVYLGYDLLHLERYDELMALITPYQQAFPQDADIPLLAGYVYKHNGQPELALAQFTEALRRDPHVLTALVNRGFILNDLGRPKEAAADFHAALSINPNDGETHLGLASAELNLGHPRLALRETTLAQKALGDSELLHLIRATAYGREHLLAQAADEYRAAIRFNPKDGGLYLGLANTLFAERQFKPAIEQLQLAQKLLPQNAAVAALSARIYAELGDRAQAMQAIQQAETLAAAAPAPTPATSQTSKPDQNPAGDPAEPSSVYLSTGQAFSSLGDWNAAMGRFTHALQLAPPANRVSVRLAIAQLMAEQGHTSDADRQLALAQMDSETGETPPMTGDQYMAVAGTLQGMHEYDLSQTYLERASVSGAPDATVHIARANNYLALGDTQRAAAELAQVKDADEGGLSYAYLMAQASVYQQQHQSTEALSSFAQAASAAGSDQVADQSLLLAGAAEGYRLTPKFSLIGDFIVQPIFEDSPVYVLDSKLDSPNGPIAPTDLAGLPTPRSSVESDAIAAFHLHLGNLPNPGGFVQVRDTRGTISVPATGSIVHRDTIDTVLNFGLNPTVHAGTNAITFNTGVEGTIRRDTESPVQMDQNLFRAFVYGTTTSFLDAVSATGYFIYETGPFTQETVSSHTLTGAVDFRVGAPWSKTALVTGWGANDQKFPSKQIGNAENYFTTSYIGLSRTFTPKLKAEAIMEDLRFWRIEPFSPIHSAIAQAIRPAATFSYAPARNWSIQANSSFEDTRGFHIYDMTQNGASVSYTRPLSRSFDTNTGQVRLRYPIRFSIGMQEETFPNFSKGSNQQFRPYFSLTLF